LLFRCIDHKEQGVLLWTSFLLAFSALLPLVNPLGSALVFLGLMGELPAKAYRTMARSVAIDNVIFLGLIEILGSAVLRFFGISLPIVQVGGGLVIASIGWSMLNEKDPHANANTKREEAVECADMSLEDLKQKAFYPFTFPVTSGPGTVVVTLTLSAHAARPTAKENILAHLGLFVAIVVLSVLVYFCYAYASKLAHVVRPSTVHGIVRMMAFIVFCIGVQITWNGLVVLLPSIALR
jgi:multiple antibiotic resistance protein